MMLTVTHVDSVGENLNFTHASLASWPGTPHFQGLGLLWLILAIGIHS